jgi:hypothetical protein
MENVSRFSYNTLITESGGDSFLEKIKKVIQFLITKVTNFFKMIFSKNDQTSKEAEVAIDAKIDKVVKIELFEKVGNSTFEFSSIAFDALDDVKEAISKDLSNYEKVAETIHDKYFPKDRKINDMLGVKKEFTLKAEQVKGIIKHATAEIDACKKVRAKLVSLYEDIERRLKTDLSEDEKRTVTNKVNFINEISGLIFNYLRSLSNLVDTDIKRLNLHFK